MASRFSIALLDASGNAQTGKTVQLYYSGGALVGAFTDNSDGTYYIDVAASGEYDVAISGEPSQDELQGIFIAVDDLSDHLADTNDPHDMQADQVDIDDTGGYFTGTDVEAALQELGSAGIEPNAVNVALSDAGGYFTTDNAEAALQQLAAAILLNFADPKRIDDDKDISQNLEILDNAVDALALASGLTNYRQVYSAYLESAVTDDAEIGSAAEWTEDTQAMAKVKIQVPFIKRSTDTTLIFTCYAKTTSVTGSDFGYIYVKDVGTGEYSTIKVLSSETSLTFKTIDLDISSLSNGTRYINIEMGINGSAGSLQMSYPVIEVQAG